MTIEQSKPAPLTPGECNLQDFPFMPLDVARLRDSDLAANETPEACWAALLLWSASWHQVPAASIPNDDMWLAKAAGYMARGKIDKAWKGVREGALRGFVECSDGRLYHPVVAEKARDAWQAKLKQRWITECARIKKHNDRHEGANVPKPTYEDWLSQGCPVGQMLPVPRDTAACPSNVPRETPSKGEGEGQREGQRDSSVPYGTGADGAEQAVKAEPMNERQLAEHYVTFAGKLPESDEKRSREDSSALWKGAKSLFWLDAGTDFTKSGTLLGKMATDYGEIVLTNAIAAMCRERPAGPAAWLKRACQLRVGEASKTNKQTRLEAANAAVVSSLVNGTDAPQNAQTALEASNAAVVAELLKAA